MKNNVVSPWVNVDDVGRIGLDQLVELNPGRVRWNGNGEMIIFAGKPYIVGYR